MRFFSFVKLLIAFSPAVVVNTGLTYASSGLGLSVVAAIMHLHGFSIDFEDAGPGLIARITIPR